VDRDDPADATQKDCTRGPGSPQMVQGSWSGPPTRTLEGQRGGARGRAPQATDIVITDLVMLERLPPGDLPDPFIYLII